MLSIIFTAIVFIIMFSIIIFVHEFGHFITAKRAGIKVEEFGFGLPPRAWGKKKGETIYSVNWIPFGGFVRLLGEDMMDGSKPKKRSFAAQSIGVRMRVVLAGVVMNFFLAWLIFTVLFTVGVEPLPILGPDEINEAVDQEEAVIVEGVLIKEVTEGGYADKLGWKAGDVIHQMDRKDLSFLSSDLWQEGGHTLSVKGEDGQIKEYEIQEGIELMEGEENVFAVEFALLTNLNRVKIFDLSRQSSLYRAGLRSGDTILKIDDEHLFSIDELQEMGQSADFLTYQVYRNGNYLDFEVSPSSVKKVMVEGVIEGSAAERAGLQQGDVLVALNGEGIAKPQDVIDVLKESPEGESLYLVERNNARFQYRITPEDGRIGVLFAELFNYRDLEHVQLYESPTLSSFMKMNEVKYSPHIAAYEAVGHVWKLSKMTAGMFVGFVKNLFVTGEIEAGVSGPVGIAVYTHEFLQQGFGALLQFMAILSLTLGVINVLPIPALDGGKFLFLLVEALRGKKANRKMEAYIHFLGYVLILLLIFYLTYNDIVTLIFGKY